MAWLCKLDNSLEELYGLGGFRVPESPFYPPLPKAHYCGPNVSFVTYLLLLTYFQIGL